MEIKPDSFFVLSLSSPIVYLLLSILHYITVQFLIVDLLENAMLIFSFLSSFL